MPHPLNMSAADTGLLVVDVQAKLMPRILDCVRGEATLGEISDVLRAELGEHREHG